MKKTKYFLCILAFSFLLFSCSNKEDFEPESSPQEQQLKSEVIYIESFEDLQKLSTPISQVELDYLDAMNLEDFVVIDKDNLMQSKSGISARSTTFPMQADGYQTYEKAGDYVFVFRFSKEMASEIGVPWEHDYSTKEYHAALRIGLQVGLGWADLPSPNCGIMPEQKQSTVSWQKRGYKSYKVDNAPNSYYMVTSLFKIFNATGGHGVGKMVPFEPGNIVWDFGVVIN